LYLALIAFNFRARISFPSFANSFISALKAVFIAVRALPVVTILSQSSFGFCFAPVCVQCWSVAKMVWQSLFRLVAEEVPGVSCAHWANGRELTASLWLPTRFSPELQGLASGLQANGKRALSLT
jgi:hypothetical protein